MRDTFPNRWVLASMMLHGAGTLFGMHIDFKFFAVFLLLRLCCYWSGPYMQYCSMQMLGLSFVCLVFRPACVSFWYGQCTKIFFNQPGRPGPAGRLVVAQRTPTNAPVRLYT